MRIKLKSESEVEVSFPDVDELKGKVKELEGELEVSRTAYGELYDRFMMGSRELLILKGEREKWVTSEGQRKLVDSELQEMERLSKENKALEAKNTCLEADLESMKREMFPSYEFLDTHPDLRNLLNDYYTSIGFCIQFRDENNKPEMTLGNFEFSNKLYVIKK
jgi:hypothetical protein